MQEPQICNYLATDLPFRMCTNAIGGAKSTNQTTQIGVHSAGDDIYIPLHLWSMMVVVWE